MVYLSERALQGLKEYKYKPGGEDAALCALQAPDHRAPHTLNKHYISHRLYWHCVHRAHMLTLPASSTAQTTCRKKLLVQYCTGYPCLVSPQLSAQPAPELARTLGPPHHCAQPPVAYAAYTGYTILDVLHNPFWEWLTNRLPMWLAPNLITLIGLLGIMLSYLGHALYFPDFTGLCVQLKHTVHRFFSYHMSRQNLRMKMSMTPVI